jgi:dUTP pyrophosphatase
MVLKMFRTDSTNPLPAYMTEGSSGMDLYASLPEPLVIEPGGFECVPAGIIISLPQGYEAQIRPRSGLAARQGVTVLNAPGTVDADYRGEVKVILINHGKSPFRVERGMRIAQMVIAQVQRADVTEAGSEQELDRTGRSSGGFGHTGM